MENILIIGGGGLAKEILDALYCGERYRPVGIIDDRRPIGEQVLDTQVVGRCDDLPRLLDVHETRNIIVAIGDNFVRAKVAHRVRNAVPDVCFPSIYHPSADVARSARLDEGVIISAGAVASADCRIGPLSYLAIGAIVCHDTIVGQSSTIGPGATVGGNASIGQFTNISLGAKVIHGITIGEHTVVGAGSTVVRDLPDRVVAYGSPARVIRERAEGESYL